MIMFYGKGGFLGRRSEGCLEDSEKRDIVEGMA